MTMPTDQKTDLDLAALPNCTCMRLRQAARAVTQLYDEALRPTGLRATQVSLLSVIAMRGPAEMKTLADVLVMDRTTLSRNIKPLISQGLVRVEAAEDRRSRPFVLTEKGRGKLEEVVPLWRAAQKRMAGGLGKDRWSGLLRDLESTVSVAQGG